MKVGRKVLELFSLLMNGLSGTANSPWCRHIATTAAARLDSALKTDFWPNPDIFEFCTRIFVVYGRSFHLILTKTEVALS